MGSEEDAVQSSSPSLARLSARADAMYWNLAGLCHMEPGRCVPQAAMAALEEPSVNGGFSVERTRVRWRGRAEVRMES
jgi:hypothetical protein